MKTTMRGGVRKLVKPVNLIGAAMLITGLAFIADGLWIKSKAVIAQILLDRAFLASTAEGPTRPWPWADVLPVARIEAPGIGKSTIVLNGVSGEALAFGPGHLNGTPMPGQRGTAVFSAHRDTHFNWLGRLKKGDQVHVKRIDGSTVSYRIRRAWVAEADHPGIDAASDEYLIALTTCWPLDGTLRSKWRYIVEGVMIKEITGNTRLSSGV